jgi:hypothetical protein
VLGRAEDWSVESATSVVSMVSLWAYEVSLWADLDALDAVERREAADLSRGGDGGGRTGGGQ